MKTKIFTFIFAIVASMNLWAADSGSCGDNLTWTLDDSGTLTISGTGNMNDYYVDNYSWSRPWGANIKTVIINAGVTSIGNYAFYGCSGLTSITIPNSVTSIGYYAFSGCVSLTSTTIPNSVTSIGGDAFRMIPNIEYYGTATGSPWGARSVNGYVEGYLVYANDSKTTLLACSAAAEGIITIPNSVTSIGWGAFSGCSGLTSITISNSVTSIGEWAFSGCSGLTSITISNSVTSIGNGAFEGCSSLTSITIPNSVTSIGNGAFRDCRGLTSITIPNSVTSIGNEAFYYCIGLTSITIPNSVTSIGGDAFRMIPNIEYYGTATGSPWGARSVNGYVEGYWVYANDSKTTLLACSAAAEGIITIPNSVTSIGISAFYHCLSLTSMTIPNSVTNIGKYAFSGCSGLTSITIPNSVTSIGDGAFLACSSLTSITIGNSVTNIEYYTFNGCNITSINYLGSVEEWINKKWNIRYISSNYTLLLNGIEQTSITIPNSVTIIGSAAFQGCTGLKQVIIGSSVKVLEESAFADCSSIETITCYSQRPPTVKENALNGLNYSTIVYVPADYLDTYKMHDAWGLYDVRPLGAKSTQTDNVQVTPQENTADIVWPAVSGASTYELVIKDKQGNIICTLIFNAQGQLTQLVFNAPAANGKQMPEQAQTAGFSFTITGLNQGTTYDYTITSKDTDGNVLDTKSGIFTTNGATGIEDVIDTQHLTQPTKVLIDGAVYILMPDGRRYNLQGAEVK